MISSENRNRLTISLVIALVVGFLGVKMFYSLTPPRHADHDHAMASLDSGGFLRIESFDGRSRNLVGRPGKVLVLHFFDPRAVDSSEQAQAALFAGSLSEDPQVEVVFVARGDSRDGMENWAKTVGVDTKQLYFDKEGRTSDMLGVQRWPETLIFDPNGRLAHQAKGSVNWSSPSLHTQIQRAKAGVAEVH